MTMTMTAAKMPTRLLFTVSGGLEPFAEDEIRRLGSSLSLDRCQEEQTSHKDDGIIMVKWRRRGNSGSQLEVSFPIKKQHAGAETEGSTSDDDGIISTDATRFIFAAMSNLRYVEYAHLQLLSRNIDLSSSEGDNGKNMHSLLERIQHEVASGISDVNNLDAALEIGRKCQQMLQDADVGLEKLPGILLPTPQVDAVSSSSLSSPNDASANRGFVVNTIYTRDEVAKVVVDEFLRLVHDTFGDGVQNKLFLDAGTGSGALLRHLPIENSLGVDTHPSSNDDRIFRSNFLKMDRFELKQFQNKRIGECAQKDLFVISNPPFAENSRGDFRAICKFINKAFEMGSLCAGVIVPVKFARERIWASLGMDKKAILLARFLLPNNSFFDPSSGKGKHISSIFLFFGLRQCAKRIKRDSSGKEKAPSSTCTIEETSTKNCLHVIGKRDKSAFTMSSADFSQSVAHGLQDAGAQLSSSDGASFSISASIKPNDDQAFQRAAVIELDLLLNPKKPLSLVQSTCRLVPEHSLGWVSTSAKPPVAYAMYRLAAGGVDGGVSGKEGGLLINAFSGEGTIELEAQHSQTSLKFFIISGDKDEAAALDTSRRLVSLAKTTGKRPRVDLVIWDAQRLPLRGSIADAYLADLPFSGGKKKAHQAPNSSSGAAVDASLDYKLVMAQSIMTLKTGGRAALLSADCKSLGFASRAFNWKDFWQSSSAINVGGMSAKLIAMQRGGPCWKDLSVQVCKGCRDLSNDLIAIARDVCEKFSIDKSLNLVDKGITKENTSDRSLIARVEHVDTYVKEDYTSHGYRFFFLDLLSNGQAKILYKAICSAVEA